MAYCEGLGTGDIEASVENGHTAKKGMSQLYIVVQGLKAEVQRLRTERNTLGNALKQDGRSEAVDLVRENMEEAGELD